MASKITSQVWRHTPVTSVHIKMIKEECCELGINLGYIVNPGLQEEPLTQRTTQRKSEARLYTVDTVYFSNYIPSSAHRKSAT